MRICSFGSHDSAACDHQAHVLKTHTGKVRSRQQAAELVLLKNCTENPGRPPLLAATVGAGP